MHKLAEDGHAAGRQEENIINDWFVSLFEHRMSYLGWGISDQKRIGSSSSQLSVGETDGLICDANKGRLGLFEAFRLRGWSASVVDDHMNKLAGYNSAGCELIIVLVYVLAPEFDQIVTKYTSHVLRQQYDGFAPIEAVPGKPHLVLVASKPAQREFEEQRYLNSVRVTIRHLLLDMHCTNAPQEHRCPHIIVAAIMGGLAQRWGIHDLEVCQLHVAYAWARTYNKRIHFPTF